MKKDIFAGDPFVLGDFVTVAAEVMNCLHHTSPYYRLVWNPHLASCSGIGPQTREGHLGMICVVVVQIAGTSHERSIINSASGKKKCKLWQSTFPFIHYEEAVQKQLGIESDVQHAQSLNNPAGIYPRARGHRSAAFEGK